jgi:pimeloyl-ACP methyl ester carboxylesterase
MYKSIICVFLIFLHLFANDSKKDKLYNFKGPDNKKRYSVFYYKQLSKWKIPYETKLIKTSYGNTHVIVCGNDRARPLVLLHGFNGTATMWKDIVEPLHNDFKIYSIDIMGDINMSEPAMQIKKSNDFAAWLKETLKGLGTEKAHFIGESYGGWQIMNAAYRYPEMFIDALVINPMPGITDFTLKGNLAFMWLALFHGKNNVRKFLNKMVIEPSSIDSDFVNLMHSAFQEGKMAIPSDGYVLNKEDYQKISFPMYFIIGDQDYFAKPESRLKKKTEFNSNSQMIVIEKAGHDLVLENPNLIVKYALDKFK